MMDSLFWIIGIPTIISLFAAIYFGNVRKDYLRGYICLTITFLLLNFGWMALYASVLSNGGGN